MKIKLARRYDVKEVTVSITYNQHGIDPNDWEQIVLDATAVYTIPEVIELSGFRFIKQDAMRWLTGYYVQGVTIKITDTDGNSQSYRSESGKPQWYWYFADFKLAALSKLPKAFMQTLTPNLKAYKGGMLDKADMDDLFACLSTWSNQIDERIRKANRWSWSTVEGFYDSLIKTCPVAFYMSPKLYAEKKAEEQFRQDIGSRYVDDVVLDSMVNKYDIPVPARYIQYQAVKTRNGFAALPTLRLSVDGVDCSTPEYNVEYPLPRDLRLAQRCRKLPMTEKDLKTVESALELFKSDDAFIGLDYARCPVCNEIYSVSEGCKGHVAPVAYVSMENLFFSNAEAYEDLEDSRKVSACRYYNGAAFEDAILDKICKEDAGSIPAPNCAVEIQVIPEAKPRRSFNTLRKHSCDGCTATCDNTCSYYKYR